MTYLDVLAKITAVILEAEDDNIYCGPEIYFTASAIGNENGETFTYNGGNVWTAKSTGHCIHLKGI